MNKALLSLAYASLVGCVTPKRPLASPGVSQHAFFPDAYTYSVGDFVLSLPVCYYEFTMQRLQFAQYILHDGSPKPVVEQQRYLVLPEYALSPRREFLVLDQHHLLISSGRLPLPHDPGPQLQVLRRDDASWTDVSHSVLPSWGRHPNRVIIKPTSGRIHVSSSSHPRLAALRWENGRFAATETAQ